MTLFIHGPTAAEQALAASRILFGEEIADELHSMLCKWLLNHIANEDRDYAQAVKDMVAPVPAAAAPALAIEKVPSGGLISGLLGRFFR